MATHSPKRSTATRDKHRALIAQGKPPCGLCHMPIDYTLRFPEPMCFVVDHITALANGGADTLTNKQAAHRICNSKKSSKQTRQPLDIGPSDW